jgi:hypothetical protein
MPETGHASIQSSCVITCIGGTFFFDNYGNIFPERYPAITGIQANYIAAVSQERSAVTGKYKK